VPEPNVVDQLREVARSGPVPSRLTSLPLAPASYGWRRQRPLITHPVRCSSCTPESCQVAVPARSQPSSAGIPRWSTSASNGIAVADNGHAATGDRLHPGNWTI